MDSGFFDNMNVGLTIPAMQIKVPAPGIPKIKVNAQFKMPPKQSLKSLLPKFKYNIPTFVDNHYPSWDSYASSSSDQQSIGRLPGQQANQMNHNFNNNQMNNHEMNNYGMKNQMNNDQMSYDQMYNEQMNGQSSMNAMHNNRFNEQVNYQSSNQNFNYPNEYLDNFKKQFDYPISETRFQDNLRMQPQFDLRNLESLKK